MLDLLISLLFLVIPVAVFALTIWYSVRHEPDAPSETHKRFAPGLWLGQGRG